MFIKIIYYFEVEKSDGVVDKVGRGQKLTPPQSGGLDDGFLALTMTAKLLFFKNVLCENSTTNLLRIQKN